MIDRMMDQGTGPAASHTGKSGSAAVPAVAAETNGNRMATPSLDINSVVDQVYQMLVRRLSSERQRKGL
jgi:hypothetical protein